MKHREQPMLCIVLLTVLLTFAAPYDAPPQLVSGAEVYLPAKQLLLAGIEGDVVVQIDIDAQGGVERCSVAVSLLPLVDSIIAAALMSARFTPAYEEGDAVAASISMTYTIDKQKLVESGGSASPELYGTVYDGLQKFALAGVQVHIEYTDNADPDIRHYLQTISTVPGQGMHNGFLTAKTDSLGRFSFRLLPPGRIAMVVAAKGYEAVRYLLDVSATNARKLGCFLEPIALDSGIEIVVYGKPLFTTTVSVEEQQIATGLTHYVSDILLTKPAIHAVPESKSMMMVRAGNPYDNRYYVCGVPFLAPYHFGGHAYADVDGLMIAALDNIDVTIDRIAGRQFDASGFRIDAQPTIYRPAHRRLVERKELVIDYNTAGQDFMLSIPSKNTDRCIQIGYTRGDSMTLSFLDFRNDKSANEFGSPANFSNSTFTGAGTIGSCEIETFSWLAKSVYDSTGKFDNVLPWGMSAVTIRPLHGGIHTVHCGGSHQYFAAGKRAGVNFYRKLSTITNGTATMRLDTLSVHGVDCIIDVNAEINSWKGALEKTVAIIVDSSRMANGSYHYHKEDLIFQDIVVASGNEFTGQLHGEFSKKYGNLFTSIDLLAAGLLYDDKPSAIADFGIAAGYETNRFQLGINGGRVTYRPDIRGLPAKRYRQKHAYTYLLSLPAFIKMHRSFTCNIQPYARYKTHEPKLDPVAIVWQPDMATGLFGAGVDANVTWKPTSWLTLENTLQRSRTARFADKAWIPYEWDIPWSVRSVVHFYFGEDPRIHFYLRGYASKGIRFDDVYNFGQIRAPDYRRIDISMQYRSAKIKSRFLTRYDAYFNLFNITDRYNTSDYFWDDKMELTSIPQGYVFCEMGVRFGFRL